MTPAEAASTVFMLVGGASAAIVAYRRGIAADATDKEESKEREMLLFRESISREYRDLLDQLRSDNKELRAEVRALRAELGAARAEIAELRSALPHG